MDVLAVWAAQQGRHITLVVGDVVDVFKRTQFFCDLSLVAALILGTSNRVKHIGKLHKVMHSDITRLPSGETTQGFQWISSVCPLDGLREVERPLAVNEYPCTRLHTVSADSDVSTEAYACLLYSHCPSHRAQRELVSAAIWVTTPVALVYTRVPAQLNKERLRFGEVVAWHSDIVVIDEADRA